MWFRTELCAANETAKWLTSLAYLRSSRRITRQHNISAASRPIFKDAGFYPDHHRDRFRVEALKGITGEDASWPQIVEICANNYFHLYALFQYCISIEATKLILFPLRI